MNAHLRIRRWEVVHSWSSCPTWQLSKFCLGLTPRYDVGAHHFDFRLHVGRSIGPCSGTVRTTTSHVPRLGAPVECSRTCPCIASHNLVGAVNVRRSIFNVTTARRDKGHHCHCHAACVVNGTVAKKYQPCYFQMFHQVSHFTCRHPNVLSYSLCVHCNAASLEQVPIRGVAGESTGVSVSWKRTTTGGSPAVEVTVSPPSGGPAVYVKGWPGKEDEYYEITGPVTATTTEFV